VLAVAICFGFIMASNKGLIPPRPRFLRKKADRKLADQGDSTS
jgi:hypothetical protein